MKSLSKVIICCIAVFLYNTSFAQLQEVLMLTVFHGDNSDQTAVRFLDDATDSFDSAWDAYKFENPGNSPNIYTVSDQKYAINALNNQFEVKTLALYFSGKTNGTYEIKAEEIGAFDSTWSITLIDQTLHTQQDLRALSAYAFSTEMTDRPNRFLLQFHKVAAIETITSLTPKDQEDFMIYAYQENIMIDMKSESGVIVISDAQGREVLNAAINANLTSPWSFNPGKSGIYIVNLFKGNKRYYKKVFVGMTI